MKVMRTRHGLRFSQHGVVISELRTTPGPTHSVFDVLAILLILLRTKNGRIALLGFAGGGMIAPLVAQGSCPELTAVDLDADSYQLFRRHCPVWAKLFKWQHAEAVRWLGKQNRRFNLILDDLSVPAGADVVKPEVCWRELPQMIRARLNPRGVAVFNLLSPPGGTWRQALASLRNQYRDALVIDFDEYENRILIAGNELLSARTLGRELKESLRRLRSRQAERVRVRTLQ